MIRNVAQECSVQRRVFHQRTTIYGVWRSLEVAVLFDDSEGLFSLTAAIVPVPTILYGTLSVPVRLRWQTGRRKAKVWTPSRDGLLVAALNVHGVKGILSRSRYGRTK